MICDARSSGYSSDVRGWLVVDGQRFTLAQVGPGFCILREPRQLSEGRAEVQIEIDGHLDRQAVLLSRGTPAGTKRVDYTDA